MNTPPTKSKDAAATTTKGDPTHDNQQQVQEQQARDARAPQRPTKEAPKAKPAETGKPVWDKPHSS